MATIYICKCGRQVRKSTNADNTGNRDTTGCKGCPYLLPWGPMEWTGKSFEQNVKGHECRMSPEISYATDYSGSADDKCTLKIHSLDLDFLEDVQAWIDEYADGQLSGRFSRDTIRGTDYCNKGRYSWSIGCAQNKKGMAAKAALIERFFGPDGHRLDMTPEEEKAHILAAIEAGKAKASGKEKDMQVYTNQYGTLFAVREHNGSPALMCKAKESEQWVMSGVLAAVKDDAKTIGELQAVLDKAAQKYNWEPVENVPVENPTDAAEDARQCAPTASDAPLLPSQSANADAQQGDGDDAANPTYSAAATAAAEETAAAPEPSDSASMTEATAANTCAQEGTANENTGAANEDDAPDVCPYLELIENSRKYNCQCSICGDRFVNTEFCNKSFRGCGWYLGQQDKTGLPDDDENELIDKSDCLCRTCGRESCFAHSCAKECPANADESCLTVSCPEYIERTDTTCECKKIFAPNGDAAATSDGSAARMCEGPDEETQTTPAAASGAAPESLHAQSALPQNAPAQDIAADAPSAQAFDYSGLDAETAERLQNLARRAMEAKQRYVLDLMEIVVEAHRELCDTVVARCDNGTFSKKDDTFRAWCASIGVSKDTAYRLLQVQALMDGSTPEEQEALADAPVKLLYAAAKPSAPAELVQAVKDGDITTHKQFKELEVKLKAVQTECDEAWKAKEKAEQERDAARDAQANLSAMANKFSKQRDVAEQRVEDAEHRADEAERRAQAAEEDAAEKDKRIRELETGRPQTIEATVVERTRMPEMAEEDAAELTTNLAASVTTVQRSFFMAAAAMAPQVKARCANTLWDTVNELATLLAASANPGYEEEEATPFD